jgi:hypothetical protein
MNEPRETDLDLILTDRTLIEAALRRAVKEAVEHHRRAGNPVATWRNGRVEWVPPEHLPTSEERPDILE